MTENESTTPKMRAKDHENYGTFTILTVIIPLVGLILGIVYLAKDKQLDKKLGEHMIALSVLFGIFWGILIVMFLPSSNTTVTTPSGNVQIFNDALQTIESKPASKEEPAVPAEYKSALAQADIYANDLYLSKNGVYAQLVSEYGGKFKPEAAQYAIENVKANWNENALEKAKLYQDELHLSPAGIRDQLVSEYGDQFTTEEAEYAVTHLNN